MKDVIKHISKKPFVKLPIPSKKASSTTSDEKPNSSLNKNLLIVENRLQGALKFLKSTSINRNGVKLSLDLLPWYLLIGSPKVGKTTLLANANIDYILEKQFQQTELSHIPTSETCDWWVTPNTVIVDTPGKFIAKTQKPLAAHSIWESFLNLLTKSRGLNAINGVIIAVSASELIHNEQRDQFLDNIKHALKSLQHKFGQELPVYFVITKCDLLPGFLDFFSESSTEELIQAWGVTMPAIPVTESLTTVFIERFNALIKRLNKQLILRLHHERNPHAKHYIKDFPLQLEHVKESIVKIFKALHHEQINCSVKGIYLTSAIQDSTEQQMAPPPEIAALPSLEVQQALEIMRAPDMPKNSYFIKQFLLHGLVNPVIKPSSNGQWQKQTILYVAIANIILMTGFFSVYTYLHKNKHQKTVVAQQDSAASFAIKLPNDEKIADPLLIPENSTLLSANNLNNSMKISDHQSG